MRKILALALAGCLNAVGDYIRKETNSAVGRLNLGACVLLIVAGVLFYGMELASHGGRKLLGQQTSGADLSLPLGTLVLVVLLAVGSMIMITMRPPR